MQGEVHDGRQVAVETVFIGIAPLPVGKLGNRGGPTFAHDVELWVLLHHRLAPVAHGYLFVVGVGVYTETVEVGILNPPDSPLDEVVECVGIVEVHIDHRGHKPSALLDVEVLGRGVRVHIGREADVGAGVGVELVYPILEREVLHPPMLGAAVIGHDVHDDLEVALVGLAHKFAVEGVAAEAWVDAVVVGSGISVIRLVGRIVEQQGGGPDSGGSQVGDVVEVVNHALEVATVTTEEGFAVGLVVGISRRVVRGVAIGKAVGHEEVYHVGCGEAGALCRAFTTGM